MVDSPSGDLFAEVLARGPDRSDAKVTAISFLPDLVIIFSVPNVLLAFIATMINLVLKRKNLVKILAVCHSVRARAGCNFIAVIG